MAPQKPLPDSAQKHDRRDDDRDHDAARADRIIDAKWNGRSSFNIPEAAEILGISVWMAYASAKKGALPTIAIGRRLIVPRHALENLLLGA
jgi:Helix-turn-helix domain